MLLAPAAACLVAAGVALTLKGNRPPPERTRSEAPSGRPVEPPIAPGDATAWLRRLDRLRVEGRSIEAMQAGWAAYRAVPAGRRAEILRALTLAMLADVPPEQASEALRRRLEADPDDLDARVALLRRALASEPATAGRPRVGRPSGDDPESLAALEAILEQAPDHAGAREGVVEALLDAGRIERARAVLEAWPIGGDDDPRRIRLQARIDLDLDGRPDRAARDLARLLESTPHDWQLRARLSRALEMEGDPESARRQARHVDVLRDLLAPDRLAARLADDLGRLGEPEALADLSELCASVGLGDLAAAWRLEAEAASAVRRAGAPGAPPGDRGGVGRGGP